MNDALISDSDHNAVRQVIAEVCGDGRNPAGIRGEQRLGDDLGIDSLQFVRLVLELEERLGFKVFNIDNLSGIRTVADIDQQVLQSGAAADRVPHFNGKEQ